MKVLKNKPIALCAVVDKFGWREKVNDIHEKNIGYILSDYGLRSRRRGSPITSDINVTSPQPSHRRQNGPLSKGKKTPGRCNKKASKFVYTNFTAIYCLGDGC